MIHKKIKVLVIDGPSRGTYRHVRCTFENSQQYHRLIRAGEIRMSTVLKGTGGNALFMYPHGHTGPSGVSILPYVGIQAHTRRKSGFSRTDFRYCAFQNIENRRQDIPAFTTRSVVEPIVKDQPKTVTKPTVKDQPKQSVKPEVVNDGDDVTVTMTITGASKDVSKIVSLATDFLVTLVNTK